MKQLIAALSAAAASTLVFAAASSARADCQRARYACELAKQEYTACLTQTGVEMMACGLVASQSQSVCAYRDWICSHELLPQGFTPAADALDVRASEAR